MLASIRLRVDSNARAQQRFAETHIALAGRADRDIDSAGRPRSAPALGETRPAARQTQTEQAEARIEIAIDAHGLADERISPSIAAIETRPHATAMPSSNAAPDGRGLRTRYTNSGTDEFAPPTSTRRL